MAPAVPALTAPSLAPQTRLAAPSMTNPTVTPKRRVLVVDDNVDACRALCRVLELTGFSVATAPDGTSALEALETGAPPDFVLTDLMLGDLDGREVARKARQLRPVPKIALITGWALEDVAAESVSEVDWVFQKPLDVRLLIDALKHTPMTAEGDIPV